ncbi:hypothetical protein SAMN05421812_12533 [Asanoa hainanensis]|uniref:Uncharacterized protein n=2 Tax=Asanoa hainanensis TaxID=560556 RepID=A0A239PF77_9ACTN|nr:hypothetical protein SAMN05421812_12533 [Asanoa hainanensis]
MPPMNSYRIALMDATDRLNSTTNLDGPDAQQALLLAAYAGVAPDTAMPADWDFYTVAMTDAIGELQEGLDLSEQVTLTSRPVLPAASDPGLREGVTTAVRRLADLYATAAGGQAGPGWRRLVWAQVAHRLDDAVAELT